MKRLVLAVISALMVFSVSGAMAATSTLDFKAGTAYPSAPDKFGFDAAATLAIGLDKYFALGIDTGFQWVKWEKAAGETSLTNVTLTQSDESSIYSVPVLASLQIRFANLEAQMGIAPYITAGVGYSWTFGDFENVSRTFSGLTYQVGGGMAFKIAQDSTIQLIIDAGYKGTDLKDKDNWKLDMSGAYAHVGIRVPLAGGADYSDY